MSTISEVSIVPHVGYSSVDYLTDYLGSVVGVTNEKGNASSIRRFKPSGSLLSGTAVTPFTFGWTGNTGSRYTGLIYAEQYNRARHPSPRTLQWTTRDRLWPLEPPYAYVNGNPVTWIDPKGTSILIGPNNSYPYLGDLAEQIKRQLSKAWSDVFQRAEFLRCLRDEGNCENEVYGGDRPRWRFGSVMDTPPEPGLAYDYPGIINFEVHDTEMDPKCKGKCGYAEPSKLDKHKFQGTVLVVLCVPNILNHELCPSPPYCALVHEIMHAIGFQHKDALFDCLPAFPGCSGYNLKIKRNLTGEDDLVD